MLNLHRHPICVCVFPNIYVLIMLMTKSPTSHTFLFIRKIIFQKTLISHCTWDSIQFIKIIFQTWKIQQCYVFRSAKREMVISVQFLTILKPHCLHHRVDLCKSNEPTYCAKIHHLAARRGDCRTEVFFVKSESGM